MVEQIARTAKQLGAAVRRRRREAGLTQAALGERAHLRQATVSALESGEAGAQLRTLIDVMAALGLELVVRERGAGSAEIEDIF